MSIQQVHAYYSFGPVTACLALNYMDRFLSLYQIPVRRYVHPMNWPAINARHAIAALIHVNLARVYRRARLG